MSRLSRRSSLIALLATVVVVGFFFFRVVQPFLFPLFFAAVLALLFRPVYDRVVSALGGRRRIASALTTVGILLMVLLPLAGALFLGGQELVQTGREIVRRVEAAEESELEERLSELKLLLGDEQFAELRRRIVAGARPSSARLQFEQPEAAELLRQLERRYSEEELQTAFKRSKLLRWMARQPNPYLAAFVRAVERTIPSEDLLEIEAASYGFARSALEGLYGRTRNLIVDVIQFVIGFVIMVLALYYFLAEGPLMLRRAEQLLPLDLHDQETLFYQFETVCRSVVLATVVAAVVQGALAGIGFAVLGLERLWLLTIVTMFLSMVPFLGAAAVWIPVSLFLFAEGRVGAAIGMAVYGGAIVSTSDNLIKAYVIHGQANLHPLVVLIALLGALSVVGLWGIFLGPIVAAFFYSLLQILNQRLAATSGALRDPPPVAATDRTPPG